jgi:hypothetical protein
MTLIAIEHKKKKEYNNYNCAIIYMYWLKGNVLSCDMELFNGCMEIDCSVS